MLVVGGSGHLGSEVCRQLLAANPFTRAAVVGTYWRAPGPVPGVRWERLDIRGRRAVDALFDTVRPSTVVHTAYDNRDWTATADGAGHVAASAARVGARLVHLSTDALHSGRPSAYLDDEPPTPVTTYGAAKAAAETAVKLVHPAAAIVRTSLIMGDADTAQVRLCLDMITGGKPGALFSDEYRCPIDVTDLAAAVLELAASGYGGLINVAGPQAVSRAELGRLVALRHGLDPASVPVSTLAEAGLVRPADVRLDISRAQSLLCTPIRPVSTLPLGAP